MICGIDLAGVESRPTGICMLGEVTSFSTVYKDAEILSLVHEFSPSLLAIDSPLSFHGEHFRDGDKELRKHYPILPLTFRGMQALAQRGINLTSLTTAPVIEVYPHASKEVLSIKAPNDLLRYGITVFPSNPHELDAAAAALTGKYYLRGEYKSYGTKDVIIVPAKAERLPDP